MQAAGLAGPHPFFPYPNMQPYPSPWYRMPGHPVYGTPFTSLHLGPMIPLMTQAPLMQPVEYPMIMEWLAYCNGHLQCAGKDFSHLIIGIGVISCPPLLFIVQGCPIPLSSPPPMYQLYSLRAVARSRGVWCCGMGQVLCHCYCVIIVVMLSSYCGRVVISSWTMLAPCTRYPPHEQLLVDMGWVLPVYCALEKVVAGMSSA